MPVGWCSSPHVRNSGQMHGIPVVGVSPRFTTQDCSGCGERIVKRLFARTHVCTQCGLLLDRDANAALNILESGRAGPSGANVGGCAERRVRSPRLEPWGACHNVPDPTIHYMRYAERGFLPPAGPVNSAPGICRVQNCKNPVTWSRALASPSRHTVVEGTSHGRQWRRSNRLAR